MKLLEVWKNVDEKKRTNLLTKVFYLFVAFTLITYNMPFYMVSQIISAEAVEGQDTTNESTNEGEVTPTEPTTEQGEVVPTEPTTEQGDPTVTEPTPEEGETTPAEPTPEEGESTPTEPTPGGGETTPTEPLPGEGEPTPTEPGTGEEVVTYQYSVTSKEEDEASGQVTLNNQDTTEPIEFKSNDQVTLKANANKGSYISDIKINGTSIPLVDETSLQGLTPLQIEKKKHEVTTFEKVLDSYNSDVTIEVTFAVQNYFIEFNSDVTVHVIDTDESDFTIENQLIKVNPNTDIKVEVQPTETSKVISSFVIDETELIDSDDVSVETYEEQVTKLTYTFEKVQQNVNVKTTLVDKIYPFVVTGSNNISVETTEDKVSHGQNISFLMKFNNDDTNFAGFKIIKGLETLQPFDVDNNEILTEDELTSEFFTVSETDIENELKIELLNVTTEIELQVLESTVQNTIIDQLTENKIMVTGLSEDSLRKQDGQSYYLLGKDAVVSFTHEDGKRFKLEDDGDYKKVFNITENIKIEKISVKSSIFKKNSFELNDPLTIVFDTKAPKFEQIDISGENRYESEDGDIWHSSVTKVSGLINNEPQDYQGISYATDVATVQYRLVSETETAFADATYNADTNEFSFNIPEEMMKTSAKYEIQVTDKAGNKTTEIVHVNVDTTAPSLLGEKAAINIVQDETNAIEGFIRFLTFGAFFSEKFEVTVNTEDSQSGVKEVQLKSSDEDAEIETKSVSEDGTVYTFEVDSVDEIVDGSLSVILKDNNNNTTEEIQVTDANSNLLNEDGKIVLDKDAPVVEMKAPEANYVRDEHHYYKDNFELPISIEDVGAGIRSVEVKVNGEVIPLENANFDTQITKSFSTVINTSNYTLDDGEFQVEVETVDNAGNKTTSTKTVYIDKTAPQLTDKILFTKENDGSFAEFLNIITFGAFFNEKVKIVVQSADTEKGSGIETVEITSASGDVEIVKTDATEDNEKVTFTIDADQFEGAFNITLKDYLGNEYTALINNTNSNLADEEGSIVFDKKAPEIKATIDMPEKTTNINLHGKEYYSQDVTFKVETNDVEAGIHKVDLLINGKEIQSYNYSEKTTEQVYTINTKDLNVSDDGSYELSVIVEDNAGNQSELEKTVYIDKEAPQLDGEPAITLSTVNDGAIGKAINFLTFGTFFNEKIKIKVHSKDNENGSGIKEVQLVGSDEGKTIELVDSDVAKENNTFIIEDSSYEGTIEVILTDYTNHETRALINTDNSNMASITGYVQIEDIAPVANIDIIPNKGVIANDQSIYNGDVVFKVSAKDAESGLNKVDIKVNEHQLMKDFSSNDSKLTEEQVYELKTSEIPINEDGSYHVSVYVEDNAGNTYKKETTIYKDITNPVVDEYRFLTKTSNGNFVAVDSTKELKNVVEINEYGFYFKEETQVIVKAYDPQVKNEKTSGLQSIKAYLHDFENGKYYAVQKNGSLKEISKAQIGQIAPIKTNSQIVIKVPKNFKGQIYAIPTDKVTNTGKSFSPDGTVVESAAQHEKETHINIEKPNTTLKTKSGQDLYNKDVPISLSIVDTYSGIAEIEWSVVSKYDTKNNQSGKMVIQNDGSLSGAKEGWSKTSTEKNLVYEMTKNIVVKNNSNDIVLNVKMKDRAGHTSTEKIQFSIDKSTPTIEVVYDNNSPDPQNNDYYNENRTATITITERNFNADDVLESIQNSDGVIPKLTGWTTSYNAENPDQSKHVARIAYTADGDYTFDIDYKDLANNKAADYAADEFTIDKTVPEVNVTYSSSSEPVNGNYYSSARTATISVKEHNFDPSRVRITSSASDNGVGKQAPVVGSWSRSGDMYTAVINYSQDGHYTFDIDFMDMAGNEATDYVMDEFVIDQTAPELKITGVENQVAYADKVSPVITYSDTNFNAEGVSVSLVGANRGEVQFKATKADVQNGQSIIVANFEKVEENDDIYTLTATVRDMAGNETKQTIMYSVNRFGSNYLFSEDVQKIINGYINKEIDIVVQEINVDNLARETVQVKLAKNGSPTTLAEGTDYTVSHSGGNGKWSVYEYVIDKKLFVNDGKYNVSLYSKDMAGNINDTTDSSKEAEIVFFMDKTEPVITPLDIEDDQQYPVDKKQSNISVVDNLALGDIHILVNDEEVEYDIIEGNYSFYMNNSTKTQDVQISAVDKAGNETELAVENLLVTKNLFVRWFNNKPLFYGLLGGGGLLLLASGGWFILRNRPNEEAQE